MKNKMNQCLKNDLRVPVIPTQDRGTIFQSNMEKRPMVQGSACSNIEPDPCMRGTLPEDPAAFLRETGGIPESSAKWRCCRYETV